MAEILAADPQAPFQVAIPYWPARCGVFWWEHFSRDEVQRDFDLAVALHHTRLSVSLTWPHFQPAQHRISLPCMRHLEYVLDQANTRGIRLNLILLPLRLASCVWAPSWALRQEVTSDTRIFTGNSASRRALRSLYRNPEMQAALARYTGDIAGAFHQHPAIANWILGDGLLMAQPPVSSTEYVDGVLSILDALPAFEGQTLWHGLSCRDLVVYPPADVRTLGAAGLNMQVTIDWWPVWARGSRLWPPFITAYTRYLSEMSVHVVRGLVEPESSNGDTASSSRSAELFVDGVWEAGAAGASPTQMFDFAPAVVRDMPFEGAQQWISGGILSTSGVPKPGAGPWTVAALEHRPVCDAPVDFSGLDPELALRDSESTARACFDLYAA